MDQEVSVLVSCAVSLPQYGSAIQLVNGQAQPVGITVGPNGTVYWADWGSGQVLKLNPGSSSPKVLLGGLANPQGVGIDAAGNLYFDQYFAGTLSELPAGSSTPQVLASGLNYPNFMSVARNGTISLITGQTAGNEIVRLNPNKGAFTTIVTAPTQNTNYGFSGVFIDRSGDLYYTMIGYDTIYRLPAGSSTPEVVLSASQPDDVWVDYAGNVFYTLYYDSVNVLPEGTSTPIVLTSAGSSRCQMAVDRNDNVFYTDNIGGVVWEIPVISPVTMTVSYSVVGGGSPTAPVLHYVLKGVSESVKLSKVPTIVTADAGTPWSVTPNPLGSSTSSQRWYSTQPLTGTASATTIQFVFQHQYYLTMNVKPAGAGTVTPNNGWYDAGNKVVIMATANAGHKFNKWTGSGTGSYTGTKNPATITMNSAVSETASFS